ncbi:hypothetical protein AAFN47_14385 [Hoeflea sp. CAU 1731]
MVWAETFDCALDGVIDVIDAIGRQIATSVETRIKTHMRTVARLKPIEELDAWGLYHRAEGPSRYASTIAEVEHAHAILSRAVTLAPDAARISAALASLEFRRQLLFEPLTSTDALMRCVDLAGRAIELDSDEPDGLVAMGCAIGGHGRPERRPASSASRGRLEPQFLPRAQFLRLGAAVCRTQRRRTRAR